MRFFTCLCLASVFTGSIQAWAGERVKGELNFATLINQYAEGAPANAPWAGYWWPFSENGIASSRYDSHNISPAAKYDMAHGGDTHAQRWEESHHNPKHMHGASWAGHCHGWTAASLLFPEPKHNVVLGSTVFEPKDIKALLTEVGLGAKIKFFGTRNRSEDMMTPEAKDISPNQYLLVLTNYIGIHKKGVAIDQYSGAEIWNQPLAAYRFDYPKPADYLGPVAGASDVHRVRLKSTIWWVNDGTTDSRPTPPLNEKDPAREYQARTLEMEVWLDAPVVFDSNGRISSSGNVIQTNQDGFFLDGEWLGSAATSVRGHPDFMWVPLKLNSHHNAEIKTTWVVEKLLRPSLE